MLDAEKLAEKYNKIPPHLVFAIVNYVATGQHPGSTLASLLNNDVFSFFNRADEETRAALPEILTLIHRICPPSSIGSPDSVTVWTSHSGLMQGT